MNVVVNQSIVIHQLKVGSISNSSVLQIGSAGIIKPLANVYNTGGFTGPAPQAGEFQPPSGLFVPLPRPR
jgi:spore germination protein PB